MNELKQEKKKTSIKQEVEKNKLLIAVVTNTNYNDQVIKITKELSNNKKICYVALSKPYDVLTKNFKTNGIKTENIIFIDAIKKGVKSKGENVVYVTSPRALTGLNIGISKVLEQKDVNTLLFDSLSTLLIYEKPMTVVKFVHGLTAKLRSLDVSAVFVVLKDDVTPDMLKNLHMFTDAVVEF